VGGRDGFGGLFLPALQDSKVRLLNLVAQDLI
jgi:hypothetical protein